MTHGQSGSHRQSRSHRQSGSHRRSGIHRRRTRQQDRAGELQERIASGELVFWDAGDALDVQGQLQAYGAITGRRKLPWRYRWPDSVRDDVLARLLALNAERYAEEVALGLHSKGAKQAARAAKAGSTAGGKRRGRAAKASQGGETGANHSEQMGLGV